MHRHLVRTARGAAIAVAIAASVAPAFGVDGVTEINQARAAAGGVTASDTAGFPVTLDRPGSFRLTGNLVVGDPEISAIAVTSDNVTIDLNGFTIACNNGGPCGAGPGDGIEAGGRANVAVSDGTVRDMGGNGIITGANARIEGVRALNNHATGIATSNASALIGNTATNNGVNGLSAGVSSTVLDNTMRSNGRGGVETSSDGVVSRNIANDNDVFGIYCNGGCTIQSNTTNGNGTGISLLGGNTIIGNTARNNTNFGIVAIGTDSGYSLNTLSGNNGGGDNAQVSGGTPIGQNFCGTNTGCP